MLIRAIPLLALAFGCAGSPSDDGEQPIPPAQLPELETVSTECARTRILDGSGAEPTSETIAALSSDGVTLCLTIDASENLVASHVAVTSEQTDGELSFFDFALFDKDGALLREGWDVSVGNIDTQTFANLEYSLPAGYVYELRLFVRARVYTPITADLSIHAFEPFE